MNAMNLRKYGTSPFSVAVVHGGPGATGDMAPVARKLASRRGVLEPLQTANTIDGQVEELLSVLQGEADPPITLIGHSWGALLSFMTAAQSPKLVHKVILVGSAVYEERYAAGIGETRLGRLSDAERREVEHLTRMLRDPSTTDKNAVFARLGRQFAKADGFNPVMADLHTSEPRYDIYQRVWSEATTLRKSGELLTLGTKIDCPVLAIHGDYDPHPIEGIVGPLSRVLKDFRIISLERCGHTPWIEQEAMNEFFEILEREIHRTETA